MFILQIQASSSIQIQRKLIFKLRQNCQLRCATQNFTSKNMNFVRKNKRKINSNTLQWIIILSKICVFSIEAWFTNPWTARTHWTMCYYFDHMLLVLWIILNFDTLNAKTFDACSFYHNKRMTRFCFLQHVFRPHIGIGWFSRTWLLNSIAYPFNVLFRFYFYCWIE